MARPKSNDKRNAIIGAAIRVIAAQGLGAPTASIAQEAGISNGSLFTYFETKADLFNQVYLDLKADFVTAALKNFPKEADLRKRFFHVWSHWMNYAAAHPEKRRVMAQLGVSEDIIPETRIAVSETMKDLIALMEQVRAQGPMKNAPKNIAGAIMGALFEATMDIMIQDPANAKKHCKAGFEALWRVIG